MSYKPIFCPNSVGQSGTRIALFAKFRQIWDKQHLNAVGDLTRGILNGQTVFFETKRHRPGELWPYGRGA